MKSASVGNKLTVTCLECREVFAEAHMMLETVWEGAFGTGKLLAAKQM